MVLIVLQGQAAKPGTEKFSSMYGQSWAVVFLFKIQHELNILVFVWFHLK